MCGQYRALATIQISDSAADKEHSRALYCHNQRISSQVHGMLTSVSLLIYPNRSVTVCKQSPAIRATILFTSVRFPLPVFRSRANLVKRQFWICVVIGCRLPEAGAIAHAWLVTCRWIVGSWCPLDSYFEWFFSGNQPVAHHNLQFVCSHSQKFEATSWCSSCPNHLHQLVILTNVIGQM